MRVLWSIVCLVHPGVKRGRDGSDQHDFDGGHDMSRVRISFAVFSMVWLGARGGYAAIDAIVDPDCFREAVGPVTVVDFEELPAHGSSCPHRGSDSLSCRSFAACP
jgi:hypothetical protein